MTVLSDATLNGSAITDPAHPLKKTHPNSHLMPPMSLESNLQVNCRNCEVWICQAEWGRAECAVLWLIMI